MVGVRQLLLTSWGTAKRTESTSLSLSPKDLAYRIKDVTGAGALVCASSHVYCGSQKPTVRC